MRIRAERGFTLIELLLSVVILSVIGGALTESIIIGLRTTDNTSTKLGASSDSLLLATYWGSDAQSAADVSTSDQTCGGVLPVARLKWTDPGAAAPGTRVVAYDLVGGSLVRRSCLNTGGPSEQTLVRDVTSATCSCSGAVISLSVTAGGFTYQVDGKKRAG